MIDLKVNRKTSLVAGIPSRPRFLCIAFGGLDLDGKTLACCLPRGTVGSYHCGQVFSNEHVLYFML